MSKMIERIARAICASNGVDPDFRHYGEGSEPEWAMYTEDAYAAIAAMREPTDAMMRASATREPTDTSSAHADWQAMIDEALR